MPRVKPALGAPLGAGDYRTLDVVSWFASHGCNPRRYRAAPGVAHQVICPWASEHSTPDQASGATLIWEPDRGWPNFHCKHDHCSGRDITSVMAYWADADRYCGQMFRRVA
jgi:hypothetical protein